eukprot:scaffold130416_cov32-Attheya_sp.AAC.1
MTEKESFSYTRGDSLRIVGGTYNGHLALFNEVKKAWIEVRVRKCPGVHRPADHLAESKEYLTTYQPPFHLEKAPELCSQDRLVAALSQARHHIDVVPPVPLFLGSGSRVQRAFENVHALLDTLEMPSTDTDLIEYSLALAQLVKVDLVKLARGERTVTQRLTDPSPKSKRMHYVGSDMDDDNCIS